MKSIRVSDMTIQREGESTRFTLSFREKIELAKQLDKLGVSVIEMKPVKSLRTDSLLIKSLSSAVTGSELAVPVDLFDAESPALVWNALQGARKPRLQVVAPVSTVNMEYTCHKKPDAVLAAIGEQVARCRMLCRNVEFVAEDAGRSEDEFFLKAVTTAVEAGAALVTVCDSAGTMLPEEFGKTVAAIRAKIPKDVALGVRCSDELYMAASCAMAAVLNGADEVKAAACGEGITSLEKIARIIGGKGVEYGIETGIRMTELTRAMGQIRRICETEKSKSSPFENGVREEDTGLALTARDELPAVIKAAARLGYDLSEEDGVKVYEAFLRIASKKDSVGSKELDAIVASAALQVPPTYKLESYVINSGNTITATCHMRLIRDGKTLESVCVGDGPVDASFLAIEQIVGHHYELDDFQISAVTEGREAMGETVVRLRSAGKVYSGRGISTDVVGSSVLAYLSAVNKIVFEEGN